MGRRKASTTVDSEANGQEVANDQETRRSTRKRTVRTTLPLNDSDNDVDDEPLIKIARGSAKKNAGKAKAVLKKEIKVEESDDDEPLVKKAAKANGVAKKGIKVEADDKKKPLKDSGPKKKTKANHDTDAADAQPSTSKKASSSKGRKIKEEEMETPLPAKTPGVDGKSNKSKKRKGSGKENTDFNNIPREKTIKTGVERKVVMKGRAAVDGHCPIAATSHVLEENDDIWDCMLNQTNIQFNNNKYYLIQLLKDDDKNAYSVWMRWGRVGANGQNSLQPCGSDLNKAKNIFTKKFSDKTKNDWDMRDCFEKVPGKYDLLAMDYSKEDTVDSSLVKIEKRKKIDSKLEIQVKELIELICNTRIMEETVVEMKYDAKKAPLGKLTTDQIKAGYLALKSIDNILTKEKYSNMELVHACNDFYTRIPHYFGMKVPPLIRTKVEIQQKVALLDALGDIQAALSVMDQPIDVNVHPVDQHYTALQCDIKPMAKNCGDYKIIERYLQSTHGKTHRGYKLELLELFVCRKDMEYQRYKDVGNSMLLYHGSRISNWAGILSQGLRIAPPEAPVTGYMFGKGIYFADMSSKSANYCWATHRSDVGFVALSEVSLGKTNDLLDADYNANKLPKGCNSVKGCGRISPKPENYTKLSDGTVVPMGPAVEIPAKDSQGYTLLYNEYIVYDPSQVRTRFLMKIKFNFS